MKHFSDVLGESIVAKRSVVCVGLDLDRAQMPPKLVARSSDGGGEGAAAGAFLPHVFILVQGYGAQGGSADDLAGLRSGEAAGIVVNASRSIIYAWRGSDREYEAAAADAARSMRDELVGVLGA